MADKNTETLLTTVNLSPDIEHIFSGFCKQGLKQLGFLPDLDKCHLRLFIYNGDDDAVIATSDYYADYEKAILQMMADKEDNEEYFENDEYEIEDIQH